MRILLILILLLSSCNSRNEKVSDSKTEEIGVLPISVSLSEDDNRYNLISSNDTISWQSNWIDFEEIKRCGFVIELFGYDTLLFSTSIKSNLQNQAASSIDNIGRDLFYFIDLNSETLLKLKLDSDVEISPYLSWLNPESTKIAFKEIDYNSKKLTAVNSSKEEIIHNLTKPDRSELKFLCSKKQ